MSDTHEFFASELGYVVLLFTLFIVPRVLQRWRIPAAITSLALGALAGPGLGLLGEDRTLHLLATFGIVSLFLFAGLEVSAGDLKREARVIAQHVALRATLVAAGAWAAMAVFEVEWRAATLIALAIFTPSTGFILDSLGRLGLSEQEHFWIKSKAIATELLALLLLFATMQSASAGQLGVATLVLVAMIAILPLLFRAFAAMVLPFAPKSEFAFLVMLALLSAYVTRQLGAYYLVGAFVVGIAARRFRERLPAVASDSMLHAVEVFASFFVPFYFFVAGAALRRADFSVPALVTGLIILAIAVPVRIFVGLGHRRAALGEDWRAAMRVAVPMLPTLVFTLVIAGILRDQFEAPAEVIGGLMVYTLLNTLIPGIAFSVPVATLGAGMPSPLPEPEQHRLDDPQ